jgi:signal peptidase II
LGAIPRPVGKPIAGKARCHGRDPMTSHPKPNALSWLALSVVVVVFDQLTKLWVLASLPEYTAIPVIDGFWNWYRTYNTGAAFSFLADAGGWQHWFFIGIAIVICVVLVVWLARTPRRDWRTALPFALVIGGAIGNLIDRFVHGHVVDFIQWHWRDWYWPAFNIADAAIVGGAIGIAVFGFVQGRSAASSRPR